MFLQLKKATRFLHKAQRTVSKKSELKCVVTPVRGRSGKEGVLYIHLNRIFFDHAVAIIFRVSVKSKKLLFKMLQVLENSRDRSWSSHALTLRFSLGRSAKLFLGAIRYKHSLNLKFDRVKENIQPILGHTFHE